MPPLPAFTHLGAVKRAKNPNPRITKGAPGTLGILGTRGYQKGVPGENIRCAQGTKIVRNKGSTRNFSLNMEAVEAPAMHARSVIKGAAHLTLPQDLIHVRPRKKSPQPVRVVAPTYDPN